MDPDPHMDIAFLIYVFNDTRASIQFPTLLGEAPNLHIKMTTI